MQQQGNLTLASCCTLIARVQECVATNSRMQLSSYVLIIGSVLSLSVYTVRASNGVDLSVRKVASSCAVQTDDIDVCPAWFKPGKYNGSCQCGKDIDEQSWLIHCDRYTNKSKINIAFCTTLDVTNASYTVYGGFCPYNYLYDNGSDLFQPQLALPRNASQLNEAMCGPLNRTGLLCGQCQNGLGPPVLSSVSKCVECFDSRYGWLVYAIAALGPTAIFCIVIIACRIDATSPTLNLVIAICQIIMNISYTLPSPFFRASIPTKLHVLLLGTLSFYGLWDLNFFRDVLPPFCISTKMSVLDVIALDYIVALCPLIFTAIVYYCNEFHDRGYRVLVVLWKPFHPCAVRFRRALDLKGSVVSVFATFFFLSFCKLLYVSYNLLTPLSLYNGCGDKVATLVYRDTSIVFFSKPHLPYAILALICLTVFVILPLVYIVFYQNSFFQRCLAKCKLNIILFSELAKVCHSGYKNGIDGTPDCRWYAGVYLLFRILFLSLFNDRLSYSPLVIVCGLTTVLSAFLQPYRNKFFNIIDTVLLGAFTFSVSYFSYLSPVNPFNISIVPVVICVTIPLLYFICFIAFKLLQKLKSLNCSQAMKNKLQPSDQDQRVPYRLKHSSEYEPLLPPAASGDEK